MLISCAISRGYALSAVLQPLLRDLRSPSRLFPRRSILSMLIRFADDFVCAFQDQKDAERFMDQGGARLERFGLEVAPDKTRTLRFCRFDLAGSGSFDFLGFGFWWEKGRTGGRFVQRRTSHQKLRSSLANFAAWIKKHHHQPLRRLFATLNSKYRAYWNYYGVIGNSASLQRFCHLTQRLLFKWLNRRSQRRSYTWAAFNALVQHFQAERPRITERVEPVPSVFL